MKTTHNNSQLDNFLRDELKNLNIQYQQSDWSDMEAMLGPEHQPIAVNISKKTILISASVVFIILVGIIISQTVHFDNSSSNEVSPQNNDSSKSLLHAVDIQEKPLPSSAIIAIDSSKTDTASSPNENKNVGAVKPIVSADTATIQKTKNISENSIKISSQKVDKKKKVSIRDSASSADTSSVQTITKPSILDTASNHLHPEPSVLTPADSSKKGKKDKKQKLRFFFRQKTDSLK